MIDWNIGGSYDAMSRFFDWLVFFSMAINDPNQVFSRRAPLEALQ